MTKVFVEEPRLHWVCLTEHRTDIRITDWEEHRTDAHDNWQNMADMYTFKEEQ